MTFAELVNSIVAIIGGIVIPVVFALAGFAFLWGVFNYFIVGGADEDKRKEGRQFILWGLIGLVVMFGVWGLIRIGLSIIAL
ncbi:MAG: hypothetical protein WDN10_01635 [bacterium]